MTPDALHYTLVGAAWVSLPALTIACLVLHRRVRSRATLLLLAGLLAVVCGQLLQLFSPVNDLVYEEFRGIVVSSGELPLQWYAGSVLSAAGLLITAAGAICLAASFPARQD